MRGEPSGAAREWSADSGAERPLSHDLHVVAEEARTELLERSALANKGIAEPMGLER